MKKRFFRIFFLILCLGVTNISPAPRAGIRHYSNFCWLNSATQCLLKLKPLTELLKDKDPETIFIPNDSKAEKFLREYTKLIQKVIKEKPKKLEPKDTYVFYQSVVSFIGRENLPSRGMGDPERIIDPFKKDIIYAAFSNDRQKIFEYKANYVSIGRCNTCEFSQKSEGDSGLFFSNLINVSSFLETSSEVTCEKCREGRVVWTRVHRLRTLPEIVILHQCPGPFEFEIDESVLSPDISEEERSRLKYNLCGFIVWNGIHYWAYTKDYDTGKWYHNDGYNDVYDKEIASDEKELAEEKVKKVFEKNRYIKDNFIGGNEEKPKVSVANVLFYVRAEKSSKEQS